METWQKMKGLIIAALAVAGVVAMTAIVGCVVLLFLNQQLRQEIADSAESIIEETVISPGDVDDNSNEAPPAYTFDTSVGLDGLFRALRRNEDIRIADVQTVIRDSLENNADFSVIIRSLLSDDLLVSADGRNYVFPIRDDLAKHDYLDERFAVDQFGEVTYHDEEGLVISQKGIDVSRYQENANWALVANDGVDFAIIRVGYRGSTEGTLNLDPNFHNEIGGALANGIDVGVYFFSQALNEREAIEEANFVLAQIADYDITYPVAISIDTLEGEPRTQDMTTEEWTDVAIAFCERIKEAGYTPMIRGNLRSFLLMLDMDRLEAYDHWLAYPRTHIDCPYAHPIWGYSTTGRVSGIYGEVALNISFKRY
jgi:GH25 family lysozyme M1 (1,4-beta-N-acetylmuramidase)